MQRQRSNHVTHVSPDIERVILQADKIGKSSQEGFIRHRFINKSSRTEFFQPIKKLIIKMMEAMEVREKESRLKLRRRDKHFCSKVFFFS